MKKGRFLWSAHRITERQKAGKARSIKGKQLKNSRSTVSKQLDVLRSSQRDNYLARELRFKEITNLRNLVFLGFFFTLESLWDVQKRGVICGYVASVQHVCIKNHSNYVVRFSFPFSLSPTILFMASIKTRTSR